MTLKIEKSKLGAAVAILQRVINAKNTLPILGNVLCKVNDDILTLIASDSEVTLQTAVPLVETDGDGQFCLPPQRLMAAIESLGDDVVTLIADTDSMKMTMQHSTGETFFPIEGGDEYPLPKEEELSEPMAVDGVALAAAIDRCLWAAANDELRAVMNGVCFRHDGTDLDIVASDGRVMVVSTLSVDAKDSYMFVLPKKAAKCLCDILTEATTIERNSVCCRIVSGAYTIMSRLIDGNYPDYTKVIPLSLRNIAAVSRRAMLTSVKRVTPFSAENVNSRLVQMSFTTDKLHLRAEDSAYAMGATDTMPIGYQGEEMEIGICGSRLAAILSKLSGEAVDVQFNAPDKPIIFEPSDQQAGHNVLMLAMPMLLGE